MIATLCGWRWLAPAGPRVGNAPDAAVRWAAGLDSAPPPPLPLRFSNRRAVQHLTTTLAAGGLTVLVSTMFPQSLDGFAFSLGADGRFLYISETVSIYLGLSQVSFSFTCAHPSRTMRLTVFLVKRAPCRSIEGQAALENFSLSLRHGAKFLRAPPA